MKKAFTILISSLALLSFTSLAAEDLSNKLIIQAIPSTEGTVLIEGKPKYEKSFNLVVRSTTKKPIELTGFVGCYKAFDENGKEFKERTVQLDLMGTLGTVPKEGEASFISDDISVYNAKFVKWTSECPALTKRP